MKHIKLYYLLIMFVSILLFHPNIGYAKIKLNEDLIGDIANTYGFIYGQDYTLDQIAKKFPDLSNDVNIARLKFKSSFHSSIKHIDVVMKENVGKNLQTLKNNIKKDLVAYLKGQEITYANAQDFINKVKKRSSGLNINEDEFKAIRTLLIFNEDYYENPEKEFIDGFRTVYSTKGNRKAKGLNIDINLPISWVAADGRRPNIVKKFTHISGASMGLLIKKVDMRGEKIVSRKDIESFINDDNFNKSYESSRGALKKSLVQLENMNGYYVRYSKSIERLNSNILVEACEYNFFYDDRLVQFYAASPISINGKLTEFGGLVKFEPLMDLVVNSMIINNMYE